MDKIRWRLKAVVAANRLYGAIDALKEAVEEFFAQLITPEVPGLAG